MENISHTLVLDIGNTKTKAGLFSGMDLLEVIEPATLHNCALWFEKHQITHTIISSVGKEDHKLISFLEGKTRTIRLSYKTPLPFKNLYRSPETLGMDRVAGVAGAMHFYPGKNGLVIDAGTCITYDFMDAKNNYLGGSISPGLNMRLQAMHEFTQKLPLVRFNSPPELTGTNTEEAILSGAFNGMLGEINEMTKRYTQQYGEVQAIICGGDAALFGKQLKNDIFAAPNLVLYGLNKILLFNVEKGL